MQRFVNYLAALTLAAILSVPAFAQTGPFSAPGQSAGSTPGGSALITSYSVASPSGTASATLVNMGLGVGHQVSPAYSGVVFVLIMFNHTSSVATDGGAVQCVYGFGTPPANAAGPTGTAIGSLRTFTSGTTTATVEHGVCGGVVQLTNLNQPIWFDVEAKAVTGGTYTLSNVDVVIFELG